MMRFALIPVKELPQAKARLAPVLDDAGRRLLAMAMFRDVLAAALACSNIDSVAVVTRDAEVLAVAADSGAREMAEPGGLNDALASAAETLAGEAGRLVVLAADLPLATAGDIAAVAQAETDIAIVPSQDGGTNALALAPGAIGFSFGPDSARRHLAAAERAGLRSLRLDLPGLAFDIDSPDDLARLRVMAAEGRGLGRQTLESLTKLGLLSGQAGHATPRRTSR